MRTRIRPADDRDAALAVRPAAVQPDSIGTPLQHGDPRASRWYPVPPPGSTPGGD